MKLKFSIRYDTRWGQTVHVVLSYLSKDGYRSISNLLLQTDDGHLWTLETAAVCSRHHTVAYLSYYYQIQDEAGHVLRQEWMRPPRVYTFDPTKDYTFPDLWRDVPYAFRFPFPPGSLLPSQEDFQKSLPKEETVLYTRTILFRVSAPHLRTGESLAVCGNHPVLGNWNPDRYLRMEAIGRQEWILSVNVFAVDTPLEYKYVVIDDETRKLKQWETGENRTLEGNRIYDNEVLVLYGPHLRVRDDSLVARMTVETEHPARLIEALQTLQGCSIKTFRWVHSYDTYVFDLDGTLLNTLEDLAASCNYALRSSGMPERTVEEVRRFVGNGVKKLMERAIPGGLDNPEFETTYRLFRKHYLVHSLDTTQPYPGIPELLRRLRDHGKHVAVVSNKFYAATQELCRHFFPEEVKIAIGERENIRKKPAPDTVLEALRQLGVTRSRAVYIGDSDVDVMTARNCGIPCISVLWGFRDREFLIAHGATTLVKSPEEIF